MDFTYLSLGAGRQSSTIAEMIVEGELPRVDLVLFADTQNEPAWVYGQVKYLQGRLAGIDIPMETVTIGNIHQNSMTATMRSASLPVYVKNLDGSIGRMRRQCTKEYKVEPMVKRVRQVLLEKGMAKERQNGIIFVNPGIRVENWLGISVDEMERMKPSRIKWITSVWPLIDKRMTANDCEMWLRKHNLPIPKKSSCLICPNHSPDFWRELKNNYPEYWKRVVDFDHFLRDGNSRLASTSHGKLFLHRKCIPLDQVDLSTPQDHGQLEMFDTCDSGYCFV